MSKWNHKGIDVSFDERNAKFVCSVGNVTLRAGSLDTLKKLIDKERSKKEAFTAFDVIEHGRVSEYDVRGETSEAKVLKSKEVTELRVTEIITKKGRFSGSAYLFHIVPRNGDGWRGTSDRPVVIRDTPEARAAIKSYFEIAVRNEFEKKRLEEETEKARMAIPHLTIEDYIAQREGKS